MLEVGAKVVILRGKYEGIVGEVTRSTSSVYFVVVGFQDEAQKYPIDLPFFADGLRLCRECESTEVGQPVCQVNKDWEIARLGQIRELEELAFKDDIVSLFNRPLFRRKLIEMVMRELL